MKIIDETTRGPFKRHVQLWEAHQRACDEYERRPTKRRALRIQRAYHAYNASTESLYKPMRKFCRRLPTSFTTSIDWGVGTDEVAGYTVTGGGGGGKTLLLRSLLEIAPPNTVVATPAELKTAAEYLKDNQ